MGERSILMRRAEALARGRRRWYLRVNGVQQGGPRAQRWIERDLREGRIDCRSELSEDQQEWLPLPAIEPFASLCRELGGRRATPPDPADEARRDAAHRALYLARTRLHGRRQPVIGIVVVVVLVTLIAATLLTTTPREGGVAIDCSAPLRPGVVLDGCSLTAIEAIAADLKGMRGRGALFQGGLLARSQLTNADLSYANLSAADLEGADLENASLFGATLSGARLDGANLGGADLRFATLRGATLGGARLQGARLEQAVWVDGQTCTDRSVGECLH